jgi:hypothetical protein
LRDASFPDALLVRTPPSAMSARVSCYLRLIEGVRCRSPEGWRALVIGAAVKLNFGYARTRKDDTVSVLFYYRFKLLVIRAG